MHRVVEFSTLDLDFGRRAQTSVMETVFVNVPDNFPCLSCDFHEDYKHASAFSPPL